MDELSKLLLGAAALSLAGCGDSGFVAAPAGSRSVVQGGPQDIGEYRSIVSSGAVPALEVLDELGFFAEHAIDLPAANCGASLCVHPMLAVAPRFDGGNWTMAFVGMNTGVDPDTLPAQPRHLVLLLGSNTGGVIQILDTLEQSLTPDDRVSLISARRLVTPAPGIPPAQLNVALLDQALRLPRLSLYAALSDALAQVQHPSFAGYQSRVLVFPESFAESGLGEAQYRDLALELARQEAPISVFRELRPSSSAPDTEPPPLAQSAALASTLADTTSGNHYATTSVNDLIQAVAVEAQTGFVPLARNLTLTVTAAEGYRIGRVYGAPSALVAEQRAVLSSPVSYVGARSGSSDTQTGRRGGGGGWFVQLLADGPATGMDYVPAEAFALDVAYDDAITGQQVTSTSRLQTPLGVGQNPPPEQPYFSDGERGKPFMMLNMYLALFTTTMLANQNECGAARAIEPMMRDAWQIFSQLFPDPDIDADFQLLTQLTGNIAQECREPIPQIVDVPFSCGYL